MIPACAPDAAFHLSAALFGTGFAYGLSFVNAVFAFFYFISLCTVCKAILRAAPNFRAAPLSPIVFENLVDFHKVDGRNDVFYPLACRAVFAYKDRKQLFILFECGEDIL